ncbi:hypothetical protein [Massilia sp. YIM B04103]|uniref:hypothetical protein n=1 Tax=Massilia sp. YIM B04103 TaxID=2963106 RepID=UPI00210DE045|nr:hypothetical protein [Massilia sp. YIM B04103]
MPASDLQQNFQNASNSAELRFRTADHASSNRLTQSDNRPHQRLFKKTYEKAKLFKKSLNTFFFEDEKFFSSWGVMFFAFLVLVNFESAPDFRWIEFLLAETALGLYGFFRFRKEKQPNQGFYRWGLMLWSFLFVTYSSFALLLLGRSFGKMWLWLLVPVWLLLSFLLVQVATHLKDGSVQSNTGLMSWVIAVGISLSGVLTFYLSKTVLMFSITIAMDILLSFVMLCGVTLWLRRLTKKRGAAV